MIMTFYDEFKAMFLVHMTFLDKRRFVRQNMTIQFSFEIRDVSEVILLL